MRNNEIAKTVSVHKRLFVVALSLLGVCMLGAVAVAIVQWGQDSVTLHSGDKMYHLAVARSATVQEKGLGGRASLPMNQGMLFAFQYPGDRCFWMKDMHFPLDIIWVDSAKHVLFIADNVPITSYPHTYCPDVPARYVVELNAGQAAAAHMYIGETLTF